MTDRFGHDLPLAAIPARDPETDPWWEAADEGRLLVPVCTSCERPFWYPRGFCPRCGSQALEWRQATGAGEVYSYAIVERAFGVWQEASPFVVAYVTLDEGVTVATNIIDVDRADLHVGLPVRAVFERAEGANTALRFRPAG
jgi:uncharacterized OB-fold protein